MTDEDRDEARASARPSRWRRLQEDQADIDAHLELASAGIEPLPVDQCGRVGGRLRVEGSFGPFNFIRDGGRWIVYGPVPPELDRRLRACPEADAIRRADATYQVHVVDSASALRAFVDAAALDVP